MSPSVNKQSQDSGRRGQGLPNFNVGGNVRLCLLWGTGLLSFGVSYYTLGLTKVETLTKMWLYITPL